MGAGVEQLRGTDPRRIGPYELVGVLGSGGMGRVYLGRTAAGVTAAVKVIHADLSRDPEFRRRFRREVETTAAITGPRLAAVLDSDVEAEHPWLATEYVAGPSLASAVADTGPLTPEAAIQVAAGVAEALAAIHAQGLVHRDVKPSNVLLASDGPRLIDFGIARGAADSRLTRTGVALGTPQFMAPEQIQGDRETGAAADLFALAGVLLYAMTGEYPFGEGSAVTLLYRIVHEAPRLEPVRPDLRPLLAACLDKDPAARPSAVEVAQHLGRLADPERTVEVATGDGADATTISGAAGFGAAGADNGLRPNQADADAGRGRRRSSDTTAGQAIPASALPTQSVATATQSATATPYPGGPTGPGSPSTGPMSPGAPATDPKSDRWRKPTAIGAGVLAGVAALVVAVTLGSGDNGTTGSSGAGKIANGIPDPVADSLTAGSGVILPNGSTSGGATPSQNPASAGQTPATPGNPTGTPATGSAPGATPGSTASSGSTAATSKPGATASGVTGSSPPKSSGSAPASHTTAPPASSAAPTTARTTSPASGSGTPTRSSADSGLYMLQSTLDSKCVNAGVSSGAYVYGSGPCSGAAAQWKVWEGSPTPGGMMTWQFESATYTGYCMGTTSSAGDWLTPCSATDAKQWWTTFQRPSGGNTVNSWNDSHYCLTNHNFAMTPTDCAGNPDGLSDSAFWWTLK
ncbi:MAG: protein kinase [Catenulispora sp.]|nr:protein kinase [Catenulispora sp.]